MMNRFFLFGVIISFLILHLYSCSPLKPPTNSPAVALPERIDQQAKASEEKWLQEDQYVVKTIPSCTNCVQGGFMPELPPESEEEAEHTLWLDQQQGLYFLAGGKELGLKNLYFDIPVLLNKTTRKWINYFTGRGREHLEHYLALSGRYAPLMGQILADHQMPRDLIYLAMAESGFQNTARSKAKAVGPWQFIKSTGTKFGLKINWFLDERKDPIKATVAAVEYLKVLKDLFGSWELAAAGYNAGEGKIARAIRRYKTADFWKLRDRRYLRSETKNYVPKIMALAIIGKNLTAFGFDDVEFQAPLNYEKIELPPLTDLYQVATHLGSSLEELHLWNPELLRWFTPPETNYALKLPFGMKAKWDGLQLDLASLQATRTAQKVPIQTGSLVKVAQQYQVKVEVLEALNTNLSEQQEIYLPFHHSHQRTDQLYTDWDQRGRKKNRRSKRTFASLIERAAKLPPSSGPVKEYYTVKPGDTLWELSKKKNVSVESLVKSNLSVVKGGLKPGEKLAIQ